MKSFAVLAIVTMGSVGCNRAPQDPSSHVDFLQLSGTLGLTAKVKQQSLTFCLSGVDAADLPTWTTNIQNAAAKWVQPMRGLTTDTLVSNFVVVPGGGACDANVAVAPNTTASTVVGTTPEINMSPDGYYGSFGVLLHNFGTAFGLGDTFVEGGFTGQCAPGQPASVMCDASLGDLQADDIKGISAVYARAFPYDHPLAALYLALGQDLGTSQFTLGASAVTLDHSAGTGAASLCVGSVATCSAQGAPWSSLAKQRDKDNTAIFETGTGVQLKDGLIVGVRYTQGALQVIRFMQFNDLTAGDDDDDGT